MFIPNFNVKIISLIPNEVLSPIIESCLKIDWNDIRFDRTEIPLQGGKVLEFPFVIKGVQKGILGQNELLAIKSCDPLINWINEFYPNHLWIRGSFGVLPPKFTLKWHIDNNWHHGICTRLHIPIITNDYCRELWVDEEIHMKVGTLYEFNNKLFHSAINEGNENRIHLIFDIIHEEQRNLVENFSDFS